MSYARYPRYKDSGVELLGEVPEHWEVKRLKHTAAEQIRNGIGEPGAFDNPEWPRYVRITDIAGPRTLRTDSFRSLPPELANEAPLRINDLLLAAVGASFGKSYLHIDDIGPACFAGFLVRYASGDGADPRFISYWTESVGYWAQVQSRVVQSTIQNFSASRYGELVLAVPSLGEQSCVVKFLDGELLKLQSLVDVQQRFIGLLNEKRQATISHAVIKGLNPAAPMKPSGVEWLGEVPAHWEITKMGRLLKSPPCYGVLVPDFDPDGVPMLRITDMERGRAQRASLTTISQALSLQYSRTVLDEGDVALSVVGTIGEALKVDSELVGANLSRAVARLQVREELEADYLIAVVGSLSFQRYVDLTCVGTAQRVLNMRDLVQFRIALPPIEEQLDIVNSVRRKMAELDGLMLDAERAISLLRERRTALISAAVTGKIDVRGMVDVDAEAP